MGAATLKQNAKIRNGVTLKNVVLVRVNYTGANQTWVVPAGVTSATFLLWGAAGGANLTCKGGSGGFTAGTLAVTPGTSYTIVVGGGGAYNNKASNFSGSTFA